MWGIQMLMLDYTYGSDLLRSKYNTCLYHEISYGDPFKYVVNRPTKQNIDIYNKHVNMPNIYRYAIKDVFLTCQYLDINIIDWFVKLDNKIYLLTYLIYCNAYRTNECNEEQTSKLLYEHYYDVFCFLNYKALYEGMNSFIWGIWSNDEVSERIQYYAQVAGYDGFDYIPSLDEMIIAYDMLYITDRLNNKTIADNIISQFSDPIHVEAFWQICNSKNEVHHSCN